MKRAPRLKSSECPTVPLAEPEACLPQRMSRRRQAHSLTKYPPPRAPLDFLRGALLLLAAGAVLLAPSLAHAHGGGLDSLGCHHNRKLGGYHCHRGPLAGQSFVSKDEALKALEGAAPQAPPAPPAAATPKPAPAEPTEAPAIVGRASVIDGDTLEIHGVRIRLFGIDAPESGQRCRDEEGADYRCGQIAALALADKIGERPVSCRKKDTDRYGRTVAVCWLGAEDLGAWMVHEGHALAYRQYSADYVPHEETAKAARRGLWRGPFIPPWEWRNAHRGQ